MGPKITGRQQQVAALVAAGATNKEIARTLGISIHTAKHHIRALFCLANGRSRTDVVLWWQAQQGTLCRPHSSGSLPAPASSPRVPPRGSVRVQALAQAVLPLPDTRGPEERFWAQVAREEPRAAEAEDADERCWIWEGACDKQGRPLCGIRGLEEHLGRGARRIAYMLLTGRRLAAVQMLVSCCPRHDPRCINPAHMRVQIRGQSPFWRAWQVHSA